MVRAHTLINWPDSNEIGPEGNPFGSWITWKQIAEPLKEIWMVENWELWIEHLF